MQIKVYLHKVKEFLLGISSHRDIKKADQASIEHLLCDSGSYSAFAFLALTALSGDFFFLPGCVSVRYYHASQDSVLSEKRRSQSAFPGLVFCRSLVLPEFIFRNKKINPC